MPTIASWNINSLRVRAEHVRDWLAARSPDVLCLQETKIRDEHFPDTDIASWGYRSVFAGQPTYNGVAILSRGAATDVRTEFDDFEDPARRVIAATVDGLRIVNLYVVNGQSVGSEKYQHKLRWLAAAQRFLKSELAIHRDVVVVGDFNVAPDDRDVHDPAAWEGKILCSEPERQALQGILDLGFVDSFRMVEAEGGHYSWWDYRQAAFQRGMGMRIDLALASVSLRERIVAASIDSTPRGWERPSDHAPVLLELS